MEELRSRLEEGDGTFTREELWKLAGLVYDTVDRFLSGPVEQISGIGSRRSEQLERLEIVTLRDLLHHLPRTYLDRRFLDEIRSLEVGQRASVVGEVVSKQVRRGRSPRFQLRLSDDTGVLSVLFWNQTYLDNQITRGTRLFCSGQVDSFRGRPQMNNPEFEVIEDEQDLEESRGIQPVYPLTEGLPQSRLRTWIGRLLDRIKGLVLDPLPPDLRSRRNLMTRQNSLRAIHFPREKEELEQARRRMKYEEFFFFQLVLVRQMTKRRSRDKGRSYPDDQVTEEFLQSLPFRLTDDQDRALNEIVTDLSEPDPMHRMLQGDVGTGKTVIAAASLVRVIENGHQAALMAPTEVLARQHAETLDPLLAAVDEEVALLVGGMESDRQEEVREGLASGTVRLVVGTHSLIQESVEFDRLAYVVVDEQHRFGVDQRRTLRESGPNVDLLVMSATPIPRSLSLSVHGDLEVSTLEEFPGGPREVTTRVRKQTDSYRDRLYSRLRDRVREGDRAFLLFPAIDDSNELDLLSATSAHRDAQKDGTFGEAGIGLLHGRMDSSAVEDVLENFAAGRIRVLFCTTVVEVGVDIPDARYMVVHNAERFGLAQLHQLRGRIGRRGQEGSCVLLLDPEADEESMERLRVLEETDDGFEVAVQDLIQRGTGELLGTEQAGMPDFLLGDPWRDRSLMSTVRSDAEQLLGDDPTLQDSEHSLLNRELTHYLERRKVRLHTG